MRTPVLMITAVFLVALGGVANADDHLVNAQKHGLAPGGNAINHTHAFTTNRAGHGGNLAPGQGSPFIGEETGTPSSAIAREVHNHPIKQHTRK